MNGHVTTFSYDSAGRLLSKTPDPALSEPTVTFTYTASGQRATMTDGTGVTTYSYDSRDRLIEKATPQGTLTYTWDDAGNVASIRSSNVGGTDVHYTWTENNQLKDVIDSHVGTFTYAYNQVGSEAELRYPNGIIKQTAYDQLNRLTDIHYTLGSNTVARYTYTLDVTGRRNHVEEHSGRVVDYTYDDAYRLIREEVGADPNGIDGRVDYVLDPVGNRLMRTSTLPGVNNQTFTYNVNDQIDGEQYDLNGNLMRDGVGVAYRYDFENRLVAVPGVGVVLHYDGDGRRAGIEVLGTARRALVDDVGMFGSSIPLEELATGQVVWRGLSHGLGYFDATQGSTHLVLRDGAVNVRHVPAGAVSDHADVDGFGVRLGSTGSNIPLGPGWSWSDSDVGPLLMGARHYDANTGRFLVSDGDLSLGGTADGHSYSFARGDPINRWDPSGRDSIGAMAAVVAIASTLQAVPAYGAGGGAASRLPRVLTVDVVQFADSQVDAVSAISDANAIFRESDAPCGITIVPQSFHYTSYRELAPLRFSPPRFNQHDPSPNQFSFDSRDERGQNERGVIIGSLRRRFSLGAWAQVLFLGEILNGALGVSFPDSWGRTLARTSVISNRSSRRTTAHELAHLLDNSSQGSDGHVGDASNLLAGDELSIGVARYLQRQDQITGAQCEKWTRRLPR